MNHVDWLQNLLHGINPTWVWIVLSWLVLGVLAIAAGIRSSQLSQQLCRANAKAERTDLPHSTDRQIDHIRELRRTIDLLQRELDLQYDVVAGLRVRIRNAGPQVTAKTLTEDQINEKETTE